MPHLVISALFLTLGLTTQTTQLPRLGPPPDGRSGALQGPLVRIATPGAGSEGLWLRIAPPQIPRYAEGAPVVIHVPGGLQAGGLTSAPMRLGDFGFVDIVFLFPGGESGPLENGQPRRSGGLYDSRGPASVRALADVIAFALGRTRSVEGKTIQEYVPGIHVLSDEAGVIGWSLGGTTIAAALGLHGKEVRGLKWYASHESPYGEGVIDGEFGTQGQRNPFYDPQTSRLDLSRLRYAQDAPVTLMGRPMPLAAGLRGALYIDANDNARFEPERDFLLSGIFLPGPPPKVYYSPMLTRAAAEKKLFGAEWPAHIAAVKEAEECWAIRDGVTNISQAVKNLPDLAVLIFAGAKDHVQDTADHLHIRLQYDGFQKAGVRWIRLNPDSNYVEWVLGRKPARIIQNAAGAKFDRSSIRTAVMPEPPDGPTAPEALAAAACELADRTRKGDWRPVLDKVLFLETPRRMRNRFAPGPP